MTIYTSTTVEKKPDKVLEAAFLVSNLPLKKDNTPPTVSNDDVDGRYLLVNARNEAALSMWRQRRRRNLIVLLLLCSLLLMMLFSLMTAWRLYYRMAQEKYVGVCGVGYLDEENHYFEFQEDVTTDARTYERIDVPKIDHFQRATILHDFGTNYTGIVDRTANRCFVKPLNYTTTKPPHDFWDLIGKLRAGYYLPDERQVRENYRVKMPEIRVNDLGRFGKYILHACDQLHTFELELLSPRLHTLQKREACSAFATRYSAGSAVTLITVLDC